MKQKASLESINPCDPTDGSSTDAISELKSGMAPDLVPAIARCVERACDRLRGLQHADGSFEGEVVWCPMILAQYVILCRVVGRPIVAAARERIVLHFRVTRRPDGGWGLHAESGSYVYVTTLTYVALRILGLSADAPLAASARNWLQAQPGGVLSIPSWGKFWLALIGLYSFRGINPCPPELFLLPKWSPVHPNHLYCHTRYIYLVMCHLYGGRFCSDLGPLGAELKEELYPVPYGTIDFARHRGDIAQTDLYVAPSRTLRFAWGAMAFYEQLQERWAPLRRLRARALAHSLRRIRFEQQTTRFQGLSPVNGILNTLALWAHDASDPMVEHSLAGVESWQWNDAQEGLRIAGARSTSWDTAFAMLAVLAAPSATPQRALLREAYAFLARAQEASELPDGHREGRDGILGGWCFSDGRHRWPVSDCAAEALSALLAAHATGVIDAPERMEPVRLAAAAKFIIDRQNDDGGFGTYERRRGRRWLERLNPSEMFGNCMTELSYVECTASAVIALCRLREQHPDCLRELVGPAIVRACALLRQRQRADGSYPGFWGINFTYATCFAVLALRAAGASAEDRPLLRAAAWLVSKQKPDGGWGEHYSGCLTDTYVEHAESQATMTSWALLALIEILGPEAEAVKRGVGWLCRSQKSDGSWPEGAVNGVFFGAAMLTYRLYPAYFPIWALNRYLAMR